MSDEQPDGVTEAAAGKLRVALMVAGQTGQVMAQAHAQRQREAAAESADALRQAERQLEAQRAMDRAKLHGTRREAWWRDAQPEALADAWRTAETWREDPTMQPLREHVRERLVERGIDPENVTPDADAYREALLAQAERLRAEAAAKRTQGSAAGIEGAELAVLASDDLLDALQQHEGAAGAGSDTAVSELEERALDADHIGADAALEYDSAERRELMAASLTAKGVGTEAIAARLVADVSFAEPAREAVVATVNAGTGKAAPPKAAMGRVRDHGLSR